MNSFAGNLEKMVFSLTMPSYLIGESATIVEMDTLILVTNIC